MNTFTRTLIFYDSKREDEVHTHLICEQLKAKGVPARAVSLADLTTAGFIDESTDILSLDLSFIGINVRRVQMFCLNLLSYKHASDEFKKVVKAVVTTCSKDNKRAWELGYGKFFIDKGTSAETAVQNILSYLRKTDNDLEKSLEAFEKGEAGENPDLPLISYRYDLYLDHLCSTLGPDSAKETIEDCLKKLLKRMEKRIGLLTAPYDSRKFAMASLPAITELLRGFETYGAGYDDPLLYALRVHIVRSAARTLVRKLAAEKYLCGADAASPESKDRFDEAVASWDALYEDPAGSGHAAPALEGLALGQDPGCKDLIRCEAAYRTALEISIMTSCPGISEKTFYGYDFDDIVDLFETIDHYAIPRSEPDEGPGRSLGVNEEFEESDSAAANAMLEAVRWLFSRADSFTKRELNCFIQYASRSAAFCKQLGIDEIKKKICYCAAKAKKLVPGAAEGDGAAASDIENALRAALGLNLADQKDGRYDLFISYKRHDRDVNKELFDEDNTQMRRLRIELCNWSTPIIPFLDVVNLPDRGDPQFMRSLDSAIDRSDNFLLVLRDEADFESEYVRHELNRYIWRYSFDGANAPLILSTKQDLKLPYFLEKFDMKAYDPSKPRDAVKAIAEYYDSQRRNADPGVEQNNEEEED